MTDQTPAQAPEVYTIEAQSIDWIVIVNKLLAKHPIEEGSDDIVAAVGGDRVVYTVKRSLVPAAEIAKAIGASVEAVERAPRILLRPLKATEGWQKPTVDYIGTA